jgi:wobble nucleotide-excising tRNase
MVLTEGSILHIEQLNQLKKSIDKSNNENNKKSNDFNSYKTKYIPSMQEEELTILDIETIKNKIENVKILIEDKVKDISKSVLDENKDCAMIISELKDLNLNIEANNKNIQRINSKKNRINQENISVRKSICNVVFNDLIDTHKSDIISIKNLSVEVNSLKQQIKEKRELQKVSKRDKVSRTIREVLNYFFSNKYTLDDETFRLVFDTNILNEGQAKDVLSAGEKNIIAFAYYLGDCHLKIDTEDDYEKLFFIIDDPISSMDFNHVYTLSGIIRNLKSIIGNINHEKFLIFTHNNDFMRILASNTIVDKKLILKDNVISEFNNNLTVPYISHLVDIYKICRKDGTPSHTTANSIRHIIETLVKFEKLNVSENSIKNYIKEHIPKESKTYTLINDLSHGGWRSEQAPISEDDFKDVCETIVAHIEEKYKGQIEYCENIN